MRPLKIARRFSFGVCAVPMILLAGCGGGDSGPTSSGTEEPTVQMTSPSPGRVCAGIVMLAANAEHADRVKFYAGSTLVGTDTSSPYEATWNTATVANGPHVLKARAEGPGGTAEDERTVTVNNQAGVIVNVTPDVVSLEVGQTQQFTALVSGTGNMAVTWAVVEGAAGGTISNAGLYTAPAVLPTPPTATVRATSVADPTKNGTAVVTLTQETTISVAVSPPSATLSLGQTQQFTAAVSGTANTAVNWAVVEGAAGGTITNAGLYTAPAVLPTPPTATVRATSVADPTKSATAQVSLTGGGSGADKEIAVLLFNLGTDCNDLTDAVLNSVTWGVWKATRITGGSTIISTGTLTQTGPGDDDWSYSPNPTDRFIIHYPQGLEEEIRFSGGGTIQITDWPTDAYNSHQLTFSYKIAGLADLSMQSVSRYTLAGSPTPKPVSPQNYTRELQCSVSGSVVYEGRTWTWNASRTANDRYEVDFNWLYRDSNNEYSGTVTGPDGTFTLNADDFFKYTYINSTHVINRGMTSRNSAISGGASYQCQDALVQWAAGAYYGGDYDENRINSVIDPNYWRASGGILKNGVILGALVFSDQPQDGQIFGPDLLLAMEGGETAILHTLIAD